MSNFALKHGGYGTAEYKSWAGVIGRATTPGYCMDRGIAVCARWRHGEGGKTGFECFLEDVGKKPSPKHSIDRIDNDGNYEPGNCRWATRKQQIRNRTITLMVEYKGKNIPLAEAVELAGRVVSYNTAWQRIKSLGYPVEEAVEQPIFPRKRRWSRRASEHIAAP